MSSFAGSIPAIITPMDAAGKVDWESFAQLIEWHIAQGSDAIVAVGTTGESATLSHAEHGAVIGFVVDRVNKRVPVIAGAGSNSTAEAIDLSRDAQKRGADALLQVVPYYNRPSQQGLYRHFRALAEAVALPQILYNVPRRTGLDLETETTVELAKIDNIVGVKEAGGDQERWEVYGSLEDFSFLSGEDPNLLAMLRCGASGIISVTANVAPALMSEFCRLGNAGDWQSAEPLHQRLLPLHQALFCEPSPAAPKWALQRMGLIASDAVRMPMLALSAEGQQQLLPVLQQLGLSNQQA